MQSYKQTLEQTKQNDLEHEQMMKWYYKKLHIGGSETTGGVMVKNMMFDHAMEIMPVSQILELLQEYQTYKDNL